MIYGHNYMDLDVFALCIDVPTLTLKFLIYTHWFLPSLGRIEVVIPTIVLAC